MSLINQVLQDLEKRHAAEPEMKSLQPHVRVVPGLAHSSARLAALAAVIAIALAAAALFFYGGQKVPVTGIAGTSSIPTPASSPQSIPIPRQVVQTPVSTPPAPKVASFSPVSRLSGELSPVPVVDRSEKPAAAYRRPATTLPPKAVNAPATQGAAPQETHNAAKSEAPDQSDAPTERAKPETVAAVEETPPAIEKQMRDVSAQERGEIAFRRGVAQLQEGRANAAELDFLDALKHDPSHSGARQALLGLLLDSGRNNEAEKLLHQALAINPRQPRHAMVLARLEVERGELTGAINTMVGVLPYVQSDPDFHAFLAALLQREGRHREAVDYYRTALRGVPGNGVWMMGLGISLRAANQAAEARDAFQNAMESRQLTPELQQFVERQVRELSSAKRK